MAEVIKEQIGSGIELLIEGLPQSHMTPAIQAKAALALVQHGIPMAGNYTAGVIGGLRVATLKIGREYYQLKYSFVALRAITALEIFSEAAAWIEFQKARGVFDGPMADDTINFLRDYLKKEQRNWLNG